MAFAGPLPINERRVHPLARVGASPEFYADGSQAEKRATRAFLHPGQASGERLIKRCLWNLKQAPSLAAEHWPGERSRFVPGRSLPMPDEKRIKRTRDVRPAIRYEGR